MVASFLIDSPSLAFDICIKNPYPHNIFANTLLNKPTRNIGLVCDLQNSNGTREGCQKVIL